MVRRDQIYHYNITSFDHPDRILSLHDIQRMIP